MAARRWLITLSTGGALALTSGFAVAEEAPPVVWYRSSEGCPDGEAFLTRLRGKASGARLAEVNDRIDFVVTLGQSRGKSSGKLERQTAGSTVAIREIEAERCDEVADVLALTLTLALNPESGAPAEAPQPGPATAPLDNERPPQTNPPPTGAAVAVSRSGAADTPIPVDHRNGEALEPSAHWLFGAELGAASGPTGALGPASGLFAESEPGLRALPGASARLTAFVARVDDSGAGFAFTTAAGRLDGCPLDFGGPKLHVRPCLGFELGISLAEGSSSDGRTDSGVWSAASGAGRASWDVTPSFVLGVSAGAYLPLVRYTFSSETGNEVDRADPIGFFGAAGAAARLP